MMMTVLGEESNRAFQAEVQTTNAFRRVIHSSRRREIHLNCLPSDFLFPFTAVAAAAVVVMQTVFRGWEVGGLTKVGRCIGGWALPQKKCSKSEKVNFRFLASTYAEFHAEFKNGLIFWFRAFWKA